MDNTLTPVETNFETKEYWLIIYLIAKKFTVVNVDCKSDSNGQPFLLWTFPAVAAEVEKVYNRGEAMPIDLHEVEDAAKLFKRNLQFFRSR